MTEEEEIRVREYLAFSHTDGKCVIYRDDGELQCNNSIRHRGRWIDFKKDSITRILDVIHETRVREHSKDCFKKLSE